MQDDFETVLTAAQKRVLATLNATLADRLSAMGPEESGLYSYYVRKLEHDALFSQCDLQALEILRMRTGQFGRVWEIGPGVGQLSIMLALDGHQVVAVESESRRAAALLALLDALEKIDGSARDRIAVVQGSFPEALDALDPVERDAVVCLGCTFTAVESKYSAFAAALARFGLGVIDFSCLFTWAPDRAEWRRRARDFASAHGVETTLTTEFFIPEANRGGELFVMTPSES